MPKCLDGGELLVLGYLTQFIKYKHELNKLYYFKGDFIHGVKSYNLKNCSTKTTRFSLVLEIYNLKQEDIKNLPFFISK